MKGSIAIFKFETDGESMSIEVNVEPSDLVGMLVIAMEDDETIKDTIEAAYMTFMNTRLTND